MAFHLPYAVALAGARRAWAEGRLGAQRKASECLYDYGDNCGCAIGVNLPPDMLAIIRRDGLNGKRVIRLLEDGVLTTDDSEALAKLQDKHDAVCLSRGGRSYDGPQTTRFMTDFAGFIGAEG